MISYQPFYDTLLAKGITEYTLIFKHGIPANTLHRMKHGEAITTKTLDTLCEILECSVSDILEFSYHTDKFLIIKIRPRIQSFSNAIKPCKEYGGF